MNSAGTVAVAAGGLVLAVVLAEQSTPAAARHRAGGGGVNRYADPGPPSHSDILALARAYEENQRSGGGPADRRVVLSDRTKYMAFDTSSSGGGRDLNGLFLIDKSDGSVYRIEGYGRRGRRAGTVRGMTADYREATERTLRRRRESGGDLPQPSNIIHLPRRVGGGSTGRAMRRHGGP